MRSGLLIGVVLLLAVAGAPWAAEFTEAGAGATQIVSVGDGGDRPEFHVGRVDRVPLIEELLDGELPADLARQMTRATGFVQRTPEDGQAPSQRTVAWLGYDDRSLYVVFFAHDDPETIRANMARRDSSNGDDLVEIQIDTYNDETRAFSFIVNPLGIQTDAIYTEGRRSNFDFSWDVVWQSDGRLTEWGYVATIEVPFKALRFEGAGPHEWGVVLVRDIQHTNENLFWPPVTTRIQGRLNQSAVMSGLDGIAPGKNFLVIPYATGRSFELLDRDTATFDEDSFDGDLGLDAKWVIKDKLSLDVTANPDFSQVESDNPQITVNQRFEVFFPERRPFFLENADLFDTPINLLFTRRIAEPRVGTRLTGKLGKTSIGILAIDDEAPGKVDGVAASLAGDRAAVGVVRVNQEFGDQSNVGVIFTQREFEQDRNTVASLDGRIKLDDNWSTTFQASLSDTVERNDPTDLQDFSDQAYNVEANRQGRHWGAHFHYQEIGPGFNTELGFVNRTDIKNSHTRQSYTFWPEGDWLISWTPAVFYGRIDDDSGLQVEETRELELGFNFRRQTNAEIEIQDVDIVLRPVDFAGLSAPRSYSGDRVELNANTRFATNFNVGGRLSFSDAINFSPPDVPDPGDPGQTIEGAPFAVDGFDASLNFGVRPSRRARVEGTWLMRRLESQQDGERVLDNRILRLRFTYQFTQKLSLRGIVQQTKTDVDPSRTTVEQDRSINGDLLLTFQVNPWTAAYLGYNSNYDNFELVDEVGTPVIVPTRNSLEQDAEQIFFKISYLFGS